MTTGRGEDREGGETASEYHKDLVSDLCLDHTKCCYSKFLVSCVMFYVGRRKDSVPHSQSWSFSQAGNVILNV